MKAILFEYGIEVKRANYPRSDGGVLIGLKPELEWKLIIEQAKPVYDARIYNIVVSENNTDNFNATYPHLKEYEINYSLVKKANTLLNTAIEDAEQEANESILNHKKRDKFMLLGLGILIRKSEGITITAKEEIILAKIKDKALNVWQNDTEVANKLQEVIDDIVPDLDSGWNTSED